MKKNILILGGCLESGAYIKFSNNYFVKLKRRFKEFDFKLEVLDKIDLNQKEFDILIYRLRTNSYLGNIKLFKKHYKYKIMNLINYILGGLLLKPIFNLLTEINKINKINDFCKINNKELLIIGLIDNKIIYVSQIINISNFIIKKIITNFINIEYDKTNFIQDKYHLSEIGHNKLYTEIIKKFN